MHLVDDSKCYIYSLSALFYFNIFFGGGGELSGGGGRKIEIVKK